MEILKDLIDDLFSLVFQFREDKIVADRFLAYFLMNFRSTKKLLLRSKLGKVGINVSVDPRVTLLGTKNIEIGDRSTLSAGVFLSARSGSAMKEGKILIGKDVVFGPNVFVTSGKYELAHRNVNVLKEKTIYKNVMIEDYVYIGAGVIILPGVRVGKSAVVGAGAIVTKNVAANSIVVSPPATKLKMRL